MNKLYISGTSIRDGFKFVSYNNKKKFEMAYIKFLNLKLNSLTESVLISINGKNAEEYLVEFIDLTYLSIMKSQNIIKCIDYLHSNFTNMPIYIVKDASFNNKKNKLLRYYELNNIINDSYFMIPSNEDYLIKYPILTKKITIPSFIYKTDKIVWNYKNIVCTETECYIIV